MRCDACVQFRRFRVSNPIIAGRLQARKTLIAQSLISLLVALAFLHAGVQAMLAAALGGFAMVFGGFVAARLALGGGITSAGPALTRLVLGLLFKWACIAAVLVLGLAVWRLPPLGLFAGVVAGLGAQILVVARR